jgi:hypothetical protein
MDQAGYFLSISTMLNREWAKQYSGVYVKRDARDEKGINYVSNLWEPSIVPKDYTNGDL